MKRINKILKRSIEVFKRCSLENGAILAADVFDKEYPKDVNWYGYVWPRDASYVCVACDLIGLNKIPEKFFNWCWEYAEGVKETGIFLAHKYHPNGTYSMDYFQPLPKVKNEKINIIIKNHVKVKVAYPKFQPDQVGSVLWAIWHHSKFRDASKFKELVSLLADGICKTWKKDHFCLTSYDLWEEREAFPKLKQVHTYSLAMCIKGLESACEICEEKEEWRNTTEKMKNVLERCYVKNRFVRIFGRKIDARSDSSLFGLVWPAEIFKAEDRRMKNTVNSIIKENEIDGGGLLRYKKDLYCGKIKNFDLMLTGGGAWPIANFWASIYFSMMNEKEKAMKYFNWVIERVEEKLPEQIKNNKPSSIIPLAWSHAMFIVAGKFLQLF